MVNLLTAAGLFAGGLSEGVSKGEATNLEREKTEIARDELSLRRKQIEAETQKLLSDRLDKLAEVANAHIDGLVGKLGEAVKTFGRSSPEVIKLKDQIGRAIFESGKVYNGDGSIRVNAEQHLRNLDATSRATPTPSEAGRASGTEEKAKLEARLGATPTKEQLEKAAGVDIAPASSDIVDERGSLKVAASNSVRRSAARFFDGEFIPGPGGTFTLRLLDPNDASRYAQLTAIASELLRTDPNPTSIEEKVGRAAEILGISQPEQPKPEETALPAENIDGGVRVPIPGPDSTVSRPLPLPDDDSAIVPKQLYRLNDGTLAVATKIKGKIKLVPVQ